MIREICRHESSLWGEATFLYTRKQGAGAWGFSGALLSFRFMVWIFVRSHTFDAGSAAYPGWSFAAVRCPAVAASISL